MIKDNKEDENVKKHTIVGPKVKKAVKNEKNYINNVDIINKEVEKEQKNKELEPRLVDKPYEEMTIEELQEGILAKMAKNGPITDQMRKDVEENIYRNSLLNWINSFR